MSLYDYKVSQEIAAHDYPIYALIMAAMHKADIKNTAKLQVMWPDIFIEFNYRYWSGGGGLMPNEVGYNPAADDNLSARRF